MTDKVIASSFENNAKATPTNIMSDEEKRNYEFNKIFDLAEKPVIEYFCYLLQKDPIEFSEIYGSGDFITDEIVLSPFEEYKSGVYLCFKLGVVEHDYKCTLSDKLRNNLIIIDVIKFLEHAVREVSSTFSVCSEKTANLMREMSVYLELDYENLSFKPVYVYPPRNQVCALMKLKEELITFFTTHREKNSWNNLSEEVKTNWHEYIQKVDNMLNSTHYDEEIASEEEKKHNLKLSNLKRIGIIFTERDDTL